VSVVGEGAAVHIIDNSAGTLVAAYLGDYYQITPGWATARTEWWNMLQRVGSGEDVETAVKTFVDNANAAAQA
jgi:multiple sugar transport system substrate-binding protein